MASIFGAFLVALASGGFIAALMRPIQAILLWIIDYIRRIYARPTSTGKNTF